MKGIIQTMDVFDSENQEVDQTPKNEAAPKERVDVWVEQLASITREDGSPKYETVEDALKALKASQEHIARIEADNAQLASKAQENITLQDTIKRLSGNMNNDEKPVLKTPADGGQSDEAAAELVKKILNQTLTERDQVTTAVNNVKQVQEALIAKYGMEKAREVIASKAKELGTTSDQLKNLSASNPKLVLELFNSAGNGAPQPNFGSVTLTNRPAPERKIEAPPKSLLAGPSATQAARIQHINDIRAKVYKENGIT